MVKLRISSSVDADTYMAAKAKYPGLISNFINDLLIDLAKRDDSAREIYAKEQEFENIETQINLLRAKQNRLIAEKIKLEEEEKRETEERAKELQLKKTTCKSCGFIKDEEHLKQYNGICKSCFLSLSGDEVRALLKDGAKSED